MNQTEIRMFAPWVDPARLPDGEVEALSFEECLARALEHGLRRFDRKTLAQYCDIHYPHFSDLIAGKRPFPATKLNAFCMFTGCDYPNMAIETIPEFATASGNLVQMIAQDVEGQPTGQLAYAERMRAHGVLRRESSFSEKKSGHAMGAVIYYPNFIVQMLGV